MCYIHSISSNEWCFYDWIPNYSFALFVSVRMSNLLLPDSKMSLNNKTWKIIVSLRLDMFGKQQPLHKTQRKSLTYLLYKCYIAWPYHKKTPMGSTYRDIINLMHIYLMLYQMYPDMIALNIITFYMGYLWFPI